MHPKLEQLITNLNEEFYARTGALRGVEVCQFRGYDIDNAVLTITVEQYGTLFMVIEDCDSRESHGSYTHTTMFDDRTLALRYAEGLR